MSPTFRLWILRAGPRIATPSAGPIRAAAVVDGECLLIGAIASTETRSIESAGRHFIVLTSNQDVARRRSFRRRLERLR